MVWLCWTHASGRTDPETLEAHGPTWPRAELVSSRVRDSERRRPRAWHRSSIPTPAKLCAPTNTNRAGRNLGFQPGSTRASKSAPSTIRSSVRPMRSRTGSCACRRQPQREQLPGQRAASRRAPPRDSKRSSMRSPRINSSKRQPLRALVPPSRRGSQATSSASARAVRRTKTRSSERPTPG